MKQFKPEVKPVEVKPAEKKVRSVHFVVDAVVNYNLVKDIHSEKFDIVLAQDIVYFVDKNSKTSYMVPMSNIRTVVFQ